MQTLEVISVNIWQILISLANLLILFLLLKKFLYKPVRKVLSERQEALDGQYAAAEEAERAAQADREAWEQKLQGAGQEADAILKEAFARAARREEKALAEARDKADTLLRQARSEAELERKKATADIRREIVDVSARLTEKMLGREVSPEDHRNLIDSFIDTVEDDGYDGNR